MPTRAWCTLLEENRHVSEATQRVPRQGTHGAMYSTLFKKCVRLIIRRMLIRLELHTDSDSFRLRNANDIFV